MADFDAWDTDGDDARRGSDGVSAGLLDPRTFPQTLNRLLPDVPSIERQAPEITGPLRTDPGSEVLQDILNAQAKLNGQDPLRMTPHPETWSINGRTYYALGAHGFDPALSNDVTAMQTPADDAAAWADMRQVAVPVGNEEKAGYIARSPSRVVVVRGQAGGSLNADTYKYFKPAGSPAIHGHIDRRSQEPGQLCSQSGSEGFVDNIGEADGYGDTQSLSKSSPAPTATVSRSQVGWHVLDNGRLKFLYPPGSMTPSQMRQMQANLNQEQKKFLRPK